MKLAVPVLLALSLVACDDVLDKPLSGMGAPTSMESMEGSWVSDVDGARLDILNTTKADWYEFKYQEQNKQTTGRFVVSYFKKKRVLNIDLASVQVNGVPLISNSSQAFLMVGAAFDDERLVLASADMEKFEKNFAKYFFASPIQTATLCKKDNELCSANFSEGNVLHSKRMKKFNDEFLKKYRAVFPGKNRVTFSPLKVSSAQ